MTQREVFHRDLARLNDSLASLGAVCSTPDGFRYIDRSRAPAALVDTYCHLLTFGYANGYLTES